ncbi:MAG TPA: FlgD immunoglobulin-like domain containing protein [Polyangia bacterium]|nr:FlgD immunoglobulin-like domain containing protein [Polyangia bacterium]
MNRPIALLTVLLAGLGPRRDGRPIRYSLAAAGDVSLAIYDQQGALVREILRADPQKAGEHLAVWDGLGRDGKPVPAGAYGWKLLETQGLHADYLLSLGANYPIGNDLSSSGGPGTHMSPFAVAADPTGIYVAALQTENIESGLIKLSRDGRTRVWSRKLPADAHGQEIAWEGARSLAIDGGEIYLLGQRFPQRVHVSDAKTGRPLRTLSVDWEPPLPSLHGASALGGATDMAVGGGLVAVSYPTRDAICWFDARTGALRATAHVGSPAGLAMDRRGTVFVASGDRIVRLTAGRPRPVPVYRGLTKPGALSIDPASGDLLVFESGDHQQVVRLSPGGKVRARYGRSGGRREGIYVAGDFRDVTDVAADGEGGFLVAEPYAAPRRVAHFGRDGQLLAEWYGGQPWDTGAAFEPGNPEALWIASAYGLDASHWIMRVLVDYPHRSWRVHSCYRYLSPDTPLMHGSGNEGNLFHIYQHAGTNYLVMEARPAIWRIDEAQWRLLPATAFSGEIEWNDANGDGVAQDSEKFPRQKQLGGPFAIPHLAENFDFFFVDSSHGPCRIRRAPVTQWTAAGAPIYGDDEIFAACPERFVSGGYNDGRWSVFLHFDPSTSKLFGAFNPGITDWCQSRDSFAQAWDGAGDTLWQVGQLAPVQAGARPRAFHNPPGFIYRDLRGIAGVTHDCLVALDVDGGWGAERAQTYVWDRDGLFVGGLFDHPELEGTPEFMYHLGGEFAHGALYTRPDGDVIFAGNWESEVRLYRITGWDTAAAPWVRLSGALTP